MIEATKENLKEESYFLYIHTPFCGTCYYARKILEEIEEKFNKKIFYEINASLHPDFMQEIKVESVPCLIIKEKGTIKTKVYTFHSVPFIVKELLVYQAML